MIEELKKELDECYELWKHFSYDCFSYYITDLEKRLELAIKAKK